ncbi:MAG: thiamine diphosphokinase [Bacilli bacterium]
MIIKVVCAGVDDFSKMYSPDDDEYLVGVDQGAETIIRNKLSPDLSIGDFDSGSINKIRNKSKSLIIYHPDKDKSDLELALIHLASKDFQEQHNTKKLLRKIILYNATGRRLDHYRSVINLLIRYTHLPIVLLDKHNRIEVVNANTVFKKNDYKYISFFAIDPDTKISLKGFKYNLDNAPLSIYDSFGLSNEILEKEGTLITNNKKILVFRSN